MISEREGAFSVEVSGTEWRVTDMSDNKMPEAVIFDMDGLMFDTEKMSNDGFVKAFGQFGYSFPMELSRQMMGSNYSNMCTIVNRYYGKTMPLDEIMKIRQQYFNDYMEKYGLPVKPGLYELLSYLKENGIKTAVASSNDWDKIERNLKLSGLTDSFDVILSGEYLTESKPNPEIFIKTAERLGLPPQDCLVLEDTPRGEEAANAAGIPVILIPDMIPIDRESTKRAAAVLPDLFGVIDYLEDCSESCSA